MASLRLRSFRKIALPSACAVWTLCTAVSVAAEFQAVDGHEYRELHKPVNPVRGEAVVGLALAPTKDDQRANVVQVFLPEPFAGQLRLETISADGSFRGEGLFDGKSQGAEWATLPLAAPGAASEDKERPADPETLSIAVRDSKGSLYVARWGAASAPGGSDTLRIYVNSRRAEMFLRVGSRVERCRGLDIPQPERFDAYCDALLSELPADGKLTLVRRDQFEEQSQPFTVRMR
jgi:hypothetical protein